MVHRLNKPAPMGVALRCLSQDLQSCPRTVAASRSHDYSQWPRGTITNIAVIVVALVHQESHCIPHHMAWMPSPEIYPMALISMLRYHKPPLPSLIPFHLQPPTGVLPRILKPMEIPHACLSKQDRGLVWAGCDHICRLDDPRR